MRDKRSSCVHLFSFFRSRVHTLLSDYEEHGLVPHHHPLNENEIPSKQQCVNLLRELWGAIQKRRKTAVQYVTTLPKIFSYFFCSIVVLMVMVELVLVSSIMLHLCCDNGSLWLLSLSQR